jgi:hypothetical protein
MTTATEAKFVAAVLTTSGDWPNYGINRQLVANDGFTADVESATRYATRDDAQHAANVAARKHFHSGAQAFGYHVNQLRGY